MFSINSKLHVLGFVLGWPRNKMSLEKHQPLTTAYFPFKCSCVSDFMLQSHANMRTAASLSLAALRLSEFIPSILITAGNTWDWSFQCGLESNQDLQSRQLKVQWFQPKFISWGTNDGWATGPELGVNRQGEKSGEGVVAGSYASGNFFEILHGAFLHCLLKFMVSKGSLALEIFIQSINPLTPGINASAKSVSPLCYHQNTGITLSGSVIKLTRHNKYCTCI